MAQPSMTLEELRDAAKQRADLVGSSFITDAEWNSYLNLSLYELYDLLIAAQPIGYYATSHTFTTTTASAYALPADFYELQGVDCASGGSTVTLKPFQFAERNKYNGYAGTLATGDLLRYTVLGSNIRFSPAPQAGQTITLWYAPKLTPLGSDSASFDGISGWLEYVVLDAAIKAKEKQQQDVSVLMAQKAAMRARIDKMATNRDVGEPAVSVDVYATGGWPGWD